jgi:hypothetical protein
MVNVIYEKDTRVPTSGSEMSYYRINIHLTAEEKKVIYSLRKPGENLGPAFKRLIEAGVESLKSE